MQSPGYLQKPRNRECYPSSNCHFISPYILGQIEFLLLKVNTCEDVLLDSIQMPKPFSLYSTSEESVAPHREFAYAMCL